MWHGRSCDVDGVVVLDERGEVGEQGRVVRRRRRGRALVRELGAEGELLVGQEVGTMTYLGHDTVTAAGRSLRRPTIHLDFGIVEFALVGPHYLVRFTCGCLGLIAAPESDEPSKTRREA